MVILRILGILIVSFLLTIVVAIVIEFFSFFADVFHRFRELIYIDSDAEYEDGDIEDC